MYENLHLNGNFSVHELSELLSVDVIETTFLPATANTSRSQKTILAFECAEKVMI